MLVHAVPHEYERNGRSRPRDDLHTHPGDRPCEPPQPRREQRCPDGEAEEPFLRREAAVGETVLAGGVAVVEASEGAEAETEDDEQEDQGRFLSAPRVVSVDEREGDGEEVEQSGAKGIG